MSLHDADQIQTVCSVSITGCDGGEEEHCVTVSCLTVSCLTDSCLTVSCVTVYSLTVSCVTDPICSKLMSRTSLQRIKEEVRQQTT